MVEIVNRQQRLQAFKIQKAQYEIDEAWEAYKAIADKNNAKIKQLGGFPKSTSKGVHNREMKITESDRYAVTDTLLLNFAKREFKNQEEAKEFVRRFFFNTKGCMLSFIGETGAMNGAYIDEIRDYYYKLGILEDEKIVNDFLNELERFIRRKPFEFTSGSFGVNRFPLYFPRKDVIHLLTQRQKKQPGYYVVAKLIVE